MGASTYGKVTWRELYPGISVDLEARGGKPVLIVKVVEEANLGALRIRVMGAEALETSSQGLVSAKTPIESLPLLPIVRDGRPLVPSIHGQELSFVSSIELQSVTPIQPPAAGQGLLYGSYLGGGKEDSPPGVDVGPDGSIYVAGYTYSPGFPKTPGAFDTHYDAREAFITRLSPDGSRLVYSTYLGGSGEDTALALGVGADGSAYVAGTSGSLDFPTTPGAYDPTPDGGFITKLDPTGASLVYSTSLGPARKGESITALALGPDGTVYVTGNTESGDFPTTPGAFDRVINNDGNESYEDTFVTALNSEGSDLLFSTFLGGEFNDYGDSIALGPDGSVYVTGDTASPDFPTTPGAYDPTPHGIFVTRVAPHGGSLVYSTYLGGSEFDTGGWGLGVDARGIAYLTGGTSSADFPTTPGAYDTTFNDTFSDDAFVTALNPEGSDLVYSTYLGGLGFEGATGLALEPDGTVTVSGGTQSKNFPTRHAFQVARHGPGDAFVSRLDPTGSELIYSSYLGGRGGVIDFGDAITVGHKLGTITIVGRTSSETFPTTMGAFDRTWNGAQDAFVATLRVAGPLVESSRVNL
jgi:hypothetical protein